MRLISKFHDYYDGAMKYFAEDKHHTYLRETKTISSCDSPSKMFIEFSQTWKWPTNLYRRMRIVGFCGKIYPVLINTYRTSDVYYTEVTEYCYTPEEAIKCENNQFTRTNTSPSHKIENTDWYGIWDLLSTRKEYLDIFLTHKTPCFSIDVIGIYEHAYPGKWELIVNPVLKDYKFQVMFDVYAAAQEIEMFMGNELAQDTQGKVPVGSDVVIAESKGFDKYSFRKQARVK